MMQKLVMNQKENFNILKIDSKLEIPSSDELIALYKKLSSKYQFSFISLDTYFLLLKRNEYLDVDSDVNMLFSTELHILDFSLIIFSNKLINHDIANLLLFKIKDKIDNTFYQNKYIELTDSNIEYLEKLNIIS